MLMIKFIPKLFLSAYVHLPGPADVEFGSGVLKYLLTVVKKLRFFLNQNSKYLKGVRASIP